MTTIRTGNRRAKRKAFKAMAQVVLKRDMLLTITDLVRSYAEQGTPLRNGQEAHRLINEAVSKAAQRRIGGWVARGLTPLKDMDFRLTVGYRDTPTEESSPASATRQPEAGSGVTVPAPPKAGEPLK